MPISYVPILKWKQGEQGALKEMPEAEKTKFMPLLEILPPTEAQRAKRDYTTNLQRTLDIVKKSWGCTPFFLDIMTYYISESVNSIHPLIHAKNIAKEIGISPIYVVPFLYDKIYMEFFNKFISKYRVYIALRVAKDDLLKEDFSLQLQSFIGKVQKDASRVDLILDFEDVSGKVIEELANDTISALQTIPFLDKWKSIIIAGTSFPETLSGYNPGENSIIRKHWGAWQEVQRIGEKKGILRPLIFSDYGIGGVTPPPDYSPFMTMSANIRYTTYDSWAVFKGRSVKTYTYDQYYSLSEMVTKHSCYMGASFSQGDEYIEKCARRATSTGNGSTWRKVGTSHHIAFVLEQLANLPAV